MTDIIVSWSDHPGRGYRSTSQDLSWNRVVNLFCMSKPNMAWCAHRFHYGIRRESHVIEGFNLVVLDVDGTATFDIARKALDGLAAFLHSTKRHGKDNLHRFRVVIPLNEILYLNRAAYRQFMHCIYDWIPFEVDRQTADRARRWMCNDSPGPDKFLMTGDFLNPASFLSPIKKEATKTNTRKSSHIARTPEDLEGLRNHLLARMHKGNRNNTLYRYGRAVLDSGIGRHFARGHILDLNNQHSNPLDMTELEATVFRSLEI